ncbi:YitT family protein [Kroppenstedtia eburnea]|uniref:YczE/YyaS/YitT family protein n=1 Tax=Kroppenstedtia eburnea TaxID=714067 RepID=UPI0036363E14
MKLATGEGKQEAQSIRPKWRPFLIRWSAFMAGLSVMSLGIAVMIRAEMGLAPWDVFHMGLASVTPLTVGMWLQLAGAAVVTLAAVLARKWPGWGAIINMMLMGWFVDGWLWVGWLWLETPSSAWGQSLMLVTGLVLIGLGNGLYIAPRLGAGPRDALVLVLAEKTSIPLSRVRLLLEVGVLVAGWLLGGPVGAGTLLFSVLIGPMMQLSMQFWDKMMKQWLGRGDVIEGIHQRKVRTDDHDGFGGPVRGKADFAEKCGRAAQPVRALPGTAGGAPAKRRIG